MSKVKLPWAFCFHADYCIESTKRAFDHIKHLGGSIVRTDFDWDRLEPTRGEWSKAAIAYYEMFVTEANARGLEVLVILFHPPKWAIKLYKRRQVDEFLECYGNYCEQVTKLYGDRVKYYQYWNEPNAVPDILRSSDYWRVFLTADKAIRKVKDQPYYGIVNWNVDSIYRLNWHCQIKKVFKKLALADPSHNIRVIGVDVYPGTWSLPTFMGGWSPLDKLEKLVTDSSHPCHGFNVALVETGFSHYSGSPIRMAFSRTESRMAKWFSNAIAYIKKRTDAFNSSEHESSYLFASIYELYDSGSDRDCSLNPELFFGVYKSDKLTPKGKVVDAIRRQLLEL